uniref:Uncharacterized protein n=1 Tax=Amphimedon queenslandica TaxID=400682 RepID=A0A1X7VF80_AMPQE
MNFKMIPIFSTFARHYYTLRSVIPVGALLPSSTSPCSTWLVTVLPELQRQKEKLLRKREAKKLKFESPPLNLPAINFKLLPSFQSFIDQTVFHYANNKIKVKVTVVDSIPVRRQSLWSRRDQARSRTDFVGLLQSERSFAHLTPKVVDEVGGLQLQVEIEGYIAPVTSDISFDSPTINSTSDHEVEESSRLSPDKETQAYTLIEQAPATFDTALLLVPSCVAFESYVEQLLFYVMGNLNKTSYKHSQHILGILIEGNGYNDRMKESLEIVISKFHNLLDADNLIYLCQTCYDVFTFNN